MQAKIAKIGDGFGLLLPKELLDACGIGEDPLKALLSRVRRPTPWCVIVCMIGGFP